MLPITNDLIIKISLSTTIMTQTAIQTLVFGAGNCVTWLDPSLSSSLIHPLTPDHVTAITDQATGNIFTYGLQTAPLNSVSTSPTLDLTGLSQPALILSSGFLWIPPANLADNYGQFTLFYVGGYNPHLMVEQDTWLINGQPAGAASNYCPSSLPATATGGGVLLKKLAGAANQFSLTFYDATGHSTTSPVFSIVNNAFLLSMHTGLNGSGHPTITAQLDGTTIWSYDAGPSNPDGLSFINQQYTGLGVGAGMGGLKQTGEVIVYEGLISAASLNAITTYLTAKWVPPLPIITIGTLSSTRNPVSSAFSATVAITNAVAVSVTTVATGTGTGWTAVAPTSGNLWTIQGTFPASISNFSLVISATDATGAETVSKSFAMVTTTLAGTLTTLQQQIIGLNPALWLDPSEATTLTISNNRVMAITDKASSSVFNITSSETPTVDSASFSVAGLAFAKPSESSSGFNYGLSLSPTSRPDLFTDNPAVFLTGPVTSNQPMGNGLQVTAADGSYTLILVLDYNGQVSGSPSVDLSITNDFPVTALNYATQIWKISATNQGSVGATITVSDAVSDAVILTTNQPASCNIQYTPNPVLPVGQPSIITWRFDPINGPVIRVNGETVSTLFLQGQASSWNGPNQLISRIFGTHALGTIGELVAFPSALLGTNLSSLEASLINKWLGGSSLAPVITNLSKTSQYAGIAYSGTVTIGNGTDALLSVSIAASAGSNWTITPDSNNTTLFHINGVMPSTPVPVSLTIYAEQDNATRTLVQTVQTTSLPVAPTIGMLSQLTGATSALFSATVTVLNAIGAAGTTGLTISATQGIGWVIVADPSGTANLYRVTGTLPSVVTEFTLTIVAVDQGADPNATSTVQRNFVLQTIGNPVVQATTFALDLTGTLVANLITNEPQVLTAANGPNNQYFLPVNGPFYGASMVLQYKPSGNMNWLTAQPGSDFIPVGELQQLATATASPVFVGVTVLNQAISGQLRISYQILGGNFVFNRQGLMTQLANMLINQRQINWSQVVNLPMFFPVGPHTHNADTDIVGLATVVASLNQNLTNLSANAQPQDFADMVAHMANQANPHLVAPVMVGLGNVPNYPPATPQQAADPTNTTTLLTPYSAALAAFSGVGQATANTPGLVQLNEGTTAGDDTNATDGLTAAGILALMTASGTNAIKTAFASGEQAVKISPYPMTFPLYWQGLQYNNLNDFIVAVQTAVGVESLSFNQITGTLFFPKNVTAPSLVTSTTSTATSSRDLTTEDPMSRPMLVPTGNW